MSRPRFAIIEAPSVLGLFPKGVERLGDALLEAGLDTRLRARRAGRIEPPAYASTRDTPGQIRNAQGIAEYAQSLADAVEKIFAAHEFPIVLGGDCSIVLGCLLAQRRRSRSGLLFIDGHADFYQPEAEPNGEAASMDLALATGRGPDVVTKFDGAKPLVRDEDVAIFGRRDRDDAAAHGSQRVEDTAIEVIELDELRANGLDAAFERVRARLMRADLGDFWIHLDADALDDAVMPAVDYRMPDGLTWNELEQVLAMAVRSGRAAGIDITVFNPALDRDGAIARAFATTLVRGLN